MLPAFWGVMPSVGGLEAAFWEFAAATRVFLLLYAFPQAYAVAPVFLWAFAPECPRVHRRTALDDFARRMVPVSAAIGGAMGAGVALTHLAVADAGALDRLGVLRMKMTQLAGCLARILICQLLCVAGAYAQTDTTPPSLVSADVWESGTALTLKFTEEMDFSIGGGSFEAIDMLSVTADGTPVSVGGASAQNPGVSITLFQFTPIITRGQVVVVSYTDPSSGDDAVALQDFAGNDVASFTREAVNNSTAVPVPALPDRAALEALYDATGGVGWTNSTNWRTSAPLREWYGVTTDTAGGVTELALNNNGLIGSLPPVLEDLVSLEELYLWGNELTGPVPAWLGNMPRLRRLNLGGNALTGAIPGALARLTNLEELYLWGNELTGSVPAWLRNLSQLRRLYLQRNRLTGPIPAVLGNLVNLEELYLNDNALTGPIPGALATLTSLEELYLWGNELTGSVPAWLGNLTRLWRLNLGGNALTGPIPGALATLTNLEELYLWGNELTGSVPAWLGNLSQLRRLYLQRNRLTGPIPAVLGNLVNLEELYLNDNALTGPIAGALATLTSLEELYLWGNELTGSVPAWLGNLTRLWRLNLGGNALTGPIPGALATLTNLEELYLWGNELTGSVPAWLGNLSQLRRLYLQRNRLTGPIPAVLGDLVNLKELALEDNALTGPIPDALATLSSLEVLHLGGNELTGGPVPAWLGNLTELRGLLLHRNRLTGPIPAVLGNLVNLEELALHDNALTGPIPGALAALTNLEQLHLSGNELTGSVPAWLGNLAQLWRLNLGGNALTGPIPGALATLTNLEELYLWGNELTGSVPAWLGNLTQLRRLDLNVNDLAGPLPLVLSALSRLAYLNIEQTALCAPDEPSFQAWLATIEFHGKTCIANQPPEPVGRLAPLVTGVGEAGVTVEVSSAFRDPEGDPLTYWAGSSAPSVASVSVAGSGVTVTPAAEGSTLVTVTATDPGDLSATQSFRVRVTAPFTDDPLVPGITPVKAVHFTELRTRIDVLRREVGLARFGWTDPVLRAGVTPVQLAHLLELREALAAAYVEAGRAVPRWTDAAPVGGTTPIRAVHLTELRSAVISPAPPPGLLTSFGAGTWRVNEDIAPGRYFTNPVYGCYWERLLGLSGALSDIIANEFLGFDSGQEIVDVRESDLAFKSNGDCATWELNPFPGPPSGTITPGRWLVGSQVAAGMYTATIARGCYYEIVRSFGGNLYEIIGNEFFDEPTRVTLTIDVSVTGFFTGGDCGTWTRTAETSAAAVEGVQFGGFDMDPAFIRENRQRHEASQPR